MVPFVLKFVSRLQSQRVQIKSTYIVFMAHLDLYYLAFPEDRTLNKALVYGIFILETLQAILLLIGKLYIFLSLASSHDDFLQGVILPFLVFQPVELAGKAIFDIIWVAIPLLGGLGMVSHIKSSFSFDL